MSGKKKILFVCIHNSARSQMAEAFVNELAPDRFIAESAGIEPGILNPIVVEAMNEIGIDISNNKTNSVFDFHKQGRSYDYVITVCDEAQAERCPVFPNSRETINWSFEDPSSLSGSHEDKLQRTGKIRDRIKAMVQKFMEDNT